MAMQNAPQYLSFLGTGFLKGDLVKFISSEQDCNDDDETGAGSNIVVVGRDLVTSVTFSESTVSSSLVLCYKFKTEPFSR